MRIKRMVELFFLVLAPAILFGLYILSVLIYGQLSYYQPAEVEALAADPNAESIGDSVLHIACWNIGYAGLGQYSDFFYDGGDMVRSPENLMNEYWQGITDFVKAHPEVDIWAFQELDTASRRSHYNNQFEAMQTTLPQMEHANLAINYKAGYVPLPITQPMGKVEAGLATFARKRPIEAQRVDFGSSYDWPNKLFMLKRCMLVEAYPYRGKKLYIINAHLSAYDDGSLKAKEMAKLKSTLETIADQGDYCIVAADWNQAPTGYSAQFDDPALNASEPPMVPKDFLPSGYTMVYDPSQPTNRSLDQAYEVGQNTVKILDFYVVSDNLSVESVETVNQGFAFSDHHPVLLCVAPL